MLPTVATGIEPSRPHPYLHFSAVLPLPVATAPRTIARCRKNSRNLLRGGVQTRDMALDNSKCCMGTSYRRLLGLLGPSDFSQMQQPAAGIF
ncbi:hypothetical protein ASPBRDRAFT_311296 [Aspergillus brasiliensis CBS 101740]|uniref:Uncharacterized protein n=1 Tax=Aspergillus brasiliensis (strain CBS 101740 / IMI 381727 / IBT 21946) TaxID=767769 RepID=A0A1L9UAP8_ASPBC|nr:hypothetical protein ASPBRDRAFT_311296 [Aspergillus brasiliensis CBS 101740]